MYCPACSPSFSKLLNVSPSASPFSDERYIRQQLRGRSMRVLRCTHSCSSRCLHPPALLLRTNHPSSSTTDFLLDLFTIPPLSHSVINTHTSRHTNTDTSPRYPSVHPVPEVSAINVCRRRFPSNRSLPLSDLRECFFFFFCYLFGFWRINSHTLLCGCCVCMQTGVRGHVDA